VYSWTNILYYLPASYFYLSILLVCYTVATGNRRALIANNFVLLLMSSYWWVLALTNAFAEQQLTTMEWRLHLADSYWIGLIQEILIFLAAHLAPLLALLFVKASFRRHIGYTLAILLIINPWREALTQQLIVTISAWNSDFLPASFAYPPTYFDHLNSYLIITLLLESLAVWSLLKGEWLPDLVRQPRNISPYDDLVE